MSGLYGKGAEIAAESIFAMGVGRVYGIPYPPVSEFFELSARKGLFTPALSTRDMANATLGRAVAGERACMATAGTALFDAMETLSYATSFEIPLLLLHVGKSIPGFGNPYPYQGDVEILTAGDGPPAVFCPAAVEEIPPMVERAFGLAETYRMPAVVYMDSALFHMTGSAEMPSAPPPPMMGLKADGARSFTSVCLDVQDMERKIRSLAEKRSALSGETLMEAYRMDDAEVALVSFGVAAYVARKAVDLLRAADVRAGLLRVITLHPLPVLGDVAGGLRGLFAVEMSRGQLAGLLRKSGIAAGTAAIEGYGGKIPAPAEIVAGVKRALS